ncbi:MBL fold metallo-hydrolase [Chryseobacterium sp. HR92]|uniref:MBL fold metallo-hydrolase n=1 Tax=Chryseobacterium sp. HR92 TaxID=3094839 RepID=UPI00388F008C|nr:MBL fold metallo-hydrolase [Chryseobacterium sp. HR92]
MTQTTSFQLIRNATNVFKYGGKIFLIDPMLAEKEAYPGFEGTPNAELRIPLVSLPVPVETLLDPDVIILTHLHPDHWDHAAMNLLPKDKTIFVQNAADANTVRSAGFTNVSVIEEKTAFEGVLIQMTDCQHGSNEAFAVPQVAESLGDASGLYFNQSDEKSVYFVGDTIWIDQVEQNLKTLKPDVVILNAGDAQLNGFGSIIMGKEDVLRVHKILPNAKIIVMHMEALNHCLLSRKELRQYTIDNNIADFVLIPEDGETIEL